MISIIRHPQGLAAVRDAVAAIPDEQLFLSGVITLGELAKGIALLDEGQRKTALKTWLDGLEQDYGERILPIDAETVRVWGESTAAAQENGRIVPAADGLIAATARCHGLRVMTRNVDDFTPMGVMLVNPWGDSDRRKSPNNPRRVRSANRNRNTPDNRNDNQGFRLARPPAGPGTGAATAAPGVARVTMRPGPGLAGKGAPNSTAGSRTEGQ